MQWWVGGLVVGGWGWGWGWEWVAGGRLLSQDANSRMRIGGCELQDVYRPSRPLLKSSFQQELLGEYASYYLHLAELTSWSSHLAGGHGRAQTDTDEDSRVVNAQSADLR